MPQASRSTAIYLALVFLSGIAVGGFGMRLYTLNSVNANVNPRNPDEFRRRYVAELRSRLKLNDEQVNRLHPVLDETRQRYRDLREKHKPELDAIQQEQVRKIRAILTEAQQPEYTKLLEERERERQRGSKH